VVTPENIFSGYSITTMAGGLMQLVAYGAQDVFLTGNPKVTFFQAVYKRHTNFAMENIEQTVNGSAGNSGRLSVTVARNGDLIGDMYLELTTAAGLATHSNFAVDANWVAERAVVDIELSIGGQRIDKHYQKWWRMYSEVCLDEAKKAQWGKMTSNPTGVSGKVYLPLIFFFNRNPGLYLPLIALQYHEVRLDIDLASDYTAYFGTVTPKVWGNYVYLDTEERRRFAQKGHEYLIEQVQHTGTDSVSVGSTKQVRLSYNHPVKELMWCFNDGGSNAQMWNFCSNAAVNAVVVECNPSLAVARQVPAMNVMSFYSTSHAGCPQLSIGSPAAANVSTLSWTEDGLAAAGAVGPLSSFKLVLNGQDRFKEQDGKYFNQMQPYSHHSGNPYPGVYSYSFALKPEEHQPTGTCNFSRIDNAQVSVTLKAGCDSSTMHMFAVNYNVLRIQSGMGGLAFSN
jgi:hypothetical protein